MDKKTFDLLMDFQSLENKIYFKLVDELVMEKAEEVADPFTDFVEKKLKIGKYLDNSVYINKDTYLIKQYEDLSSYLKVNIIYEYENDWVLCSTTSELICFVPKSYLAEYK